MTETPMWDDDDFQASPSPNNVSGKWQGTPQELDSSVKTEGQKLGRVAVNHDKNKNKTRRSPVAYLQLSLATSTLTKGN